MSINEKTLNLIGRSHSLFAHDLNSYKHDLSKEVTKSSFLVIGGGGSIGQAVTKEIFKRNPKKIHVVDISENNLVELTRDIRSSLGYIDGDFQTFSIDCGSIEFNGLMDKEGHYDYIFNLSALKHVRSEKDPYTLMRLLTVNILNTVDTYKIASTKNTKKYFCVSTDKAANPVNMMGASKRIMEMLLMKDDNHLPVSLARFANVAFSDGSLLHGFNQRYMKRQPIAAPNDVLRYFLTPEESGQLCLMSGILGNNNDIFFPKLNEDLHLTTFSEIATQYIRDRGFEPHICESEEEARNEIDRLIKIKKWPCYFFKSDTTGEKDFEEFFTPNEELNLKKFSGIGIVKSMPIHIPDNTNKFIDDLIKLKESKSWTRKDLVDLVHQSVSNLDHKDTGKFLDEKM